MILTYKLHDYERLSTFTFTAETSKKSIVFNGCYETWNPHH